MKKIILLFAALLVAFFLPLALARAEEKAHDCIVVVLDGSGSMNDRMSQGRSRMDVAKTALMSVLARVPSDTQIGIVVFNGVFGGTNDWIVPLGPRDPAMNDKIDAVRPGGSTPLGEYVKRGADALLAERGRQFNEGRYRLIVVTDGQASDSDIMSRTATETVERGIRLDVIGLDMDGTHDLAAMADSYQPAQNASELDRALAKVVTIESSSNPGQAGGDDFALVSALSDDVAPGLIQAVTAPKGNWPIGEGPPKPKASEPDGSDGMPQGSPTSATAPQPQASPGCSVIGFGSISVLTLLLVLQATLRRRRSAA